MKYLLLSLLLLLSSLQFARAQQLVMSLEWICSTTNTADFQVRLTNTGSVPLTFNALIVRGIHAPTLTTGTISWQALNDNTIPEWLAWPQFTTNLAYNPITRQLNFSSNVTIFTSVTAPLIAPGSNVIVGSFRIFTSTTWVPNSDFNFVWSPTGAVNCYLPGMTTVTSFQQTGFSSNTICGQCVTVNASIAQPLNLSAPTSPANQSFCSTATISDLIASPLYISPQIASILWYDTPTGGTALNPTSLITSGTYYAAQMVNGCESITRVASIVSINQNNTTSTNVALNKPATASATYSPNPTSMAFDGITNILNGNAWTAPTYAGWIQVDLQGSFSVNTIKLYVSQSPNGITTHEIYSAPSISGPWTFVEALTGFTSSGQILVRDYSASPLLNVGAIKVQTTNSPSWVSWGEIEVYSGSLSESITASGPLTFCDGNSVTLSASSGAGYTYQWKKDGINITSANTSTYVATTSGSYTLVITNSVGCSSTTSATEVLVNLSTTPIFTQVSPICAGDMLSALPTNSINNITGTWSPALSNLASTTYTFTPTAGLCATTQTMDLTITTSTTNTTPTSACGTYTWANNGQTYTASGTYTGATVNCVTEILDLTITPSTTNTTPISACGTYTWANNGQTYTASGIYSGTTENCVTEILDLTITPSTTNTTPTSACGTYTWANNGQTYTASGIYLGTITNCITEILNLTITPSSINTTLISSCGSYTWLNNSQTYTTSGIYSGTTANCVTETLNLTITPNSTNTTSISACGTYTWLNNGQTYTVSGTYNGTTTNCVTQTIDLTIIPSTTNTTPISACGTYTWANNGQTYTTSGIYSGTTANCISETLNLTITPSTTNTTPISACGTYTWANNGQTYSTSGIYSGTTANCITQVLNLSITPNSSFTTTINECNTYTWANNGQTYTASGVFNGTVINCVLQVLDLEINDCISDSDNDGLTDYEESFLCTNSSLFDTDGDGLSDGDEDAQGSDPCDPCNPSINSVNCILGIHIPTAFSPNGSGFSENNVYQIIAGQDIAGIAFKIIDRWGNILFESEDKEFQWDGSYKGQKCNNGVYAYFVDVSYSNGKKEKLSGNITMIR